MLKNTCYNPSILLSDSLLTTRFIKRVLLKGQALEKWNKHWSRDGI